MLRSSRCAFVWLCTAPELQRAERCVQLVSISDSACRSLPALLRIDAFRVTASSDARSSAGWFLGVLRKRVKGSRSPFGGSVHFVDAQGQASAGKADTNLPQWRGYGESLLAIGAPTQVRSSTKRLFRQWQASSYSEFRCGPDVHASF